MERIINRVRAFSQKMANQDLADPYLRNQKGVRSRELGPDDKDLVFEGALPQNIKANLVTSHARNDPGMHLPCIDLDFDAILVESKTPGHHHLYLDKKVSWDVYVKLLQALAEAGIIEEGYAAASIARGCTALRPPKIEGVFEELQRTAASDPFYIETSGYGPDDKFF